MSAVITPTIQSAEMPKFEGLQAKILNFLGAGIDHVRVASAVGCDPSYISQLLADESFALAVSNKRLGQLQQATDRDSRLDGIEDKLITRVEELADSSLNFRKPMEAVRALQTVNSLKRRGAGDVLTTQQHNTIVTLVLPNVVTNKFSVDINNQVIKAGEQTLVTVSSGSVAALAEKSLLELGHDKTSIISEAELF